MVRSYPRNLTYLKELAETRFEAARFERIRGDLNAAIENCKKGADVLQTINKSNTGIQPAGVVSAAGIFEMAETLLLRGYSSAAARDAEDATERLAEVLKADPQDAVAQRSLARGRILQAKVLAVSGSLSVAKKYFLDAAERADRLVALDHTNASAMSIQATAYAELALALRKAGQAQEASQSMHKCSDLIKSMRASGQTISSELLQLLKDAGNGDED